MTVLLSRTAAVSAQGLTWNPAVTAAGTSDSNVFGETGDGRADRFATVILDVPIDYKPSSHVSLRAHYFDQAEWYQKYSELDDGQARTQGQLGLLLTPRPRTQLRMDGTYTETNRPSEIFTDTGAEFLRDRATSWAGAAGLNQGLGERSTLDLSYAYHLGKVASIEDELHTAAVQLMRHFSRTSELGVRGAFERRLSENGERFDSSVVTANWNQELTPRLSFAVVGGARFSQDAKTRPEGRASLTWQRRHWEVQVGYVHTLGYTPRSAGSLADRLGTSDTATATLAYRSRRFRLSAGPSWYWTQNDSLDVRSFRVIAQLDVSLANWMSLTASYGYQKQNGTVGSGDQLQDADSNRSVGRAGIVLAPWNRRGAESLPWTPIR